MNTETKVNLKTGLVEPGWGAKFWLFLHGLVEYPDLDYEGKPARSRDVCREINRLMFMLSELLPCKYCRAHFTAVVKKKPPPKCRRDAMRIWLFEVHNEVSRRINADIKNKKYGKRENRRIKKIWTREMVLDAAWQKRMKLQVPRFLPFVVLTIDYSIKCVRKGQGRDVFKQFLKSLMAVVSSGTRACKKNGRVCSFIQNPTPAVFKDTEEHRCILNDVKRMRVKK